MASAAGTAAPAGAPVAEGSEQLLTAHDAVSVWSKSYCLKKEGHTLGNVLRHMITRDEDVEMCGYTIPHPMEDLIHMRVQVRDNGKKTADEALEQGLTSLEHVCDKLTEKITAAYDARDEVA